MILDIVSLIKDNPEPSSLLKGTLITQITLSGQSTIGSQHNITSIQHLPILSFSGSIVYVNLQPHIFINVGFNLIGPVTEEAGWTNN